MKKFTRACFVFLIVFFVFTSFSCISIKDDILLHVAKSAAVAVMENADTIENALQDFTPEQEYYIGRSVAAQILTRYDLYESKMMDKYLNYICATLVANSDVNFPYKGYSIGIMDTNEINAFATSGGHILISKGLINCAKSEDALAAVIAHEIAHIQLKHNINAISANRKSEALSKIGLSFYNDYTDGKNKELLNIFDEIITEGISSLVDSGYSKVQEFDADKKALAIMASAGYNPEAMGDILSVLKEDNRKIGWGKTHPSPKKRLNNLEKEYKKYNVPDTSASRESRFAIAMKYF